MFSAELSNAIRHEIGLHAQELGDELDGVEEVVGDCLFGELHNEWTNLIDTHGFERVTKEVKDRFL